MGETPIFQYQIMEIILEMFQEVRRDMKTVIEDHNRRMDQQFDKIKQVPRGDRRPRALRGQGFGGCKDDFTAEREVGVNLFENQLELQPILWFNSKQVSRTVIYHLSLGLSRLTIAGVPAPMSQFSETCLSARVSKESRYHNGVRVSKTLKNLSKDRKRRLARC